MLRYWWRVAIRREETGEEGQGLAEYGLILALIAVVCAGAVATFGQAVANSAGWRIFQAIAGA